jgi:phosphoribosylglycinamide formyltransferase-1
MSDGPPLRIGVLASGRGSNFEAIVRAVASGAIPGAVVAVLISDRAEAPALVIARSHGIEPLAIEARDHPGREAHDKAILGALEERNVGLVCLAGYLRLLSRDFVRHFAGRLLNIHPSLLPAFPGLHAQREALEYGVRVAGATVHFVDEGTDTGPIVLQAAVPVHAEDTEASLAARILAEEHRIYPEAVRLFAERRIRFDGRRVQITETP